MSCVTHHFACDCREQHFFKQAHQMAEREAENQKLRLKLIELRQSSRGTILNEDGDPLYALIPLHLLNDQ